MNEIEIERLKNIRDAKNKKRFCLIL
jgi:hypothetical protein